MSNTLIQIKRSATNPAPSTLSPGELAFSNVTGGSGVLFVGSTDGGTVVPIGGVRNPGTLTANQAIVVNATSSIDQIKVGNISFVGTTQTITANGSTGTSGYVLISGGSSSNVYWAGAGGLGVNVDAQYTWTNTQTFQNTITFSSNLYGNFINATTVNSATFQVGTSLTANATLVNAAALNVVNQINTATFYASTSANVGANVQLTTSQLLIGNSTVFSQVNSTVVNTATINATVAVYTNTVYATNVSATTVNATTINATGTIYTNTVSATNGTFSSTVNAVTINATGAIYTNTFAATNVSATNINATTINATATIYTNTVAATNVSATNINATTINATATIYTNTVAATNVSATNINATTINATATIYTNTVSAVNVSFSDTLNLGSTFIANTTKVIFTGANIDATSAALTIRDITASGNLIVSGTLTYINTTTLDVKDNLVEFAANNTTTDVVDAGFFSPAGNSTAVWYSGLARIANWSANNNAVYRIFASNTNPNTATTIESTSNTATSTLVAYLAPFATSSSLGGAFVVNTSTITVTANSTVNVNITANTISLSSALGVGSGGTGLSSVSTAGLLYGNSTGPLGVLGIAANGNILQVTNNLPAWGSIDAGTF